MRALRRFGLFWVDFIVGDDWTLAVVVVIALTATWALSRAGFPGWVAMVVIILARELLVTSLRGAHGGYRLNRTLCSIRVAEVIEAIDGPIALTACVDGGDCESQCLCPMRGRWDPVNAAIRAALNSITLADMESAAMPPLFDPSEMPARATMDVRPEPVV